jgi:hypothetical protein
MKNALKLLAPSVRYTTMTSMINSSLWARRIGKKRIGKNKKEREMNRGKN